jgi:N-acetylglucosaminyldiphosphoundecaprenol N-acetyl-beta-D-mannosaminyltransferase
MGVDVHAVTQQQAVDHIIRELQQGRGGHVITPNLDHLRRARYDLSFAALLEEAQLVVPDGMPLIWASRILGNRLPERVAGSDLMVDLCGAAAVTGHSVYLLGGDPNVAEKAAAELLRRFPGLKIAGTHCPPIGFEDNPQALGNIINLLSSSRPDIVFVALGSPKQERLMSRIGPILPRAWWLGVGISFSFLSGDVRRAPRWMQKIGAEWLFRLTQEPRRLFKRYIVHGIPFAASLLLSCAWRRVSGQKDRPRRRDAELAGSRFAPAPLAPVPASQPVSDAGEMVAAARNGRTTRRVNGNGRAHAGTNGRMKGARADGLSRLRGLVLLGGRVRGTPLTTAIQRSVLDLPIAMDESILTHWLAHAADLQRYARLSSLPVRVMVNRDTPEPVTAAARFRGAYRVERDSSELRGTGGLLHDLAGDYDDDDMILVASASQMLVEPLEVIASALEHKHADVALVSHEDGTPSSAMLLRVKTLRQISPIGYVDMKEQALPVIARDFDVQVVQWTRLTARPIRSLHHYIDALRFHHRRKSGRAVALDPLAEDWEPSFSIVEEGASVDPRAVIHDAVVLKGASVEADCAVARSIVCPGAVLKRGTSTVDQLLTRGTGV